MSKETTYPIGDGAHHRRGQFVKSHPNSRCLSVSPVHQRRCALNTGHTGEHACNGAVWSVDLGDMFGFPNSEPSTAQVDPASFRHQRDQAQAAIRELLEFIDTKDALIRDLCETIIWLDSDECNDAHEWPAFVKRCRDILASGYEMPT